jgi:transcriptional regulator with XRE-family HTH domain
MKTLKPRGWEKLTPLITIRKDIGFSQALIANRARLWQADVSRAESGLSPTVSERFVARYRSALVELLRETAAQGDNKAAKALKTVRRTIEEIKKHRGD